MWSTRGWNGGSSCDSYDEEIFDVHILSDFLKVKFIGVLLEYLSPLIFVKGFYFRYDLLMTHLFQEKLFKQFFGKSKKGVDSLGKG